MTDITTLFSDMADSAYDSIRQTSFLKHVVPTVNEDTKNGLITITGLNTLRTITLLESIYGSASKYMFSHVANRSLLIDSWFVPEMIWMIRKVIKEQSSDSYTLNTLLEQLETKTWWAKTQNAVDPTIDYKLITKKLKWKLLSHQDKYLHDYDRMVNSFGFKGGLFAGTPGSGKTFSAVSLAVGLKMDLVIVICPKSTLVDPWLTIVQDVYYEVPAHWSPRSNRKISKTDRYIIVNYEGVAKVEEQLKSLYKGKPPRTLVVLDESHNLNTVDSARTKAYLSIVDNYATNTLALSGTPIKALGQEIIPLLRAVDPLFNPRVELKFRKMLRGHGDAIRQALTNRINLYMEVVSKDKLGMKPYLVETRKVSFKGSEEFTLPVVREKMVAFSAELLGRYMEQRPKLLEEYHQLSKIGSYDRGYNEYRRLVEMIISSNNYSSLYIEINLVNQFEKNVIQKLLSNNDRKRFREIKAIAKYPRLKVLGETLGSVLAGERIRCNAAIAKHINYGEIIGHSTGKTLIFTQNIPVVKAAMTALKDYTAVYVAGDTVKSLPEIVNEFTTNPVVNPLVATYSSLSTGVPVTVASNVVIIDSPSREHILAQAIARAHRLGNDQQVTVWYVLLDTNGVPNLNDRFLELAKWSSTEVSSILGIETSTRFPEELLEESFTQVSPEVLSKLYAKVSLESTESVVWKRWAL